MIKIFAPFTEEQVKMLKWWQEDVFHPYTCLNRGGGGGRHLDSDKLVPTVNGWVCSKCDYKQNWALLPKT
jgi:hypothetical protein